MKRICLAFLFLIARPAFSAITDPQVLQEKTYVVHFTTTPAANATPNFILVSLSTTTGVFPHSDSGEIDVSGINLLVDKAAASTCTVKIGVVNYVNNSTGSVTYFYTRSINKNVSNTVGNYLENFAPAFYRCKVKKNSGDVDGSTPYILSNEKLSGSSILQATTTVSLQLLTPAGTSVTPKVGDIFMQIGMDAASVINFAVDIFYHSEP